MIHLEVRFSCACSACGCGRLLDAANWDTAVAEVRLLRCRHGRHPTLILRKIVLTEYDEQGYLTDLDLLTRELRKIA